MDRKLLEKLSNSLENTDETTRIYAAEDLGYEKCLEAAELLLNRLPHEQSIAVREAIKRALANIDSEDLVEKLAELLGNQDAFIRNMAVTHLRKVGSKKANFLLKHMKSATDPDIRKFILDIAIDFEEKTAHPFFAEGLKDPDINVLIRAVEGSGQFHYSDFREKIEEFVQSRNEPMLLMACFDALSSIGSEQTLPVIEKRFGEFEKVREFYLRPMLKIYGKVGKTDNISRLEKICQLKPHLTDFVLSSAILPIFSRFSEDPIPETILSMIQESVEKELPEKDKLDIYYLIGSRQKNPKIRTLIETSLNSKNRINRLGAAIALSMLSSEISRELINNRLKIEKDPEVKEMLQHVF
ncbi:MAG: HEAT repeat domain-containing protein [Candidatus Riflebacteria bacterium]|nr:HEAT repeat domain-containing protein [Candidatus Riflebacteria bacterium]